MIEEKTFTQQEQTPENPANWLSKLSINTYTGEESRQFSKIVRYEAGTEPWDEVTQEFKDAWKAAHSTETYGDRVSRYIHEKYDVATETACINNYLLAIDEKSALTDEEREKYINYYNEYQSYRAECKERAKEEQV